MIFFILLASFVLDYMDLVNFSMDEASYVELVMHDVDDVEVDGVKVNQFDWMFVKRLFVAFGICLKDRYMLSLIILATMLSVCNIYVVSKTGEVIGEFYASILANDVDLFYSVWCLWFWLMVGDSECGVDCCVVLCFGCDD